MDRPACESVCGIVKDYVGFIQELFVASGKDPRVYLQKCILKAHRLPGFEGGKIWPNDFPDYSVIAAHIFTCVMCKESFWNAIQERFGEFLNEA